LGDAPTSPIFALLQFVSRGGSNTGPADSEGSIVIRGRSRQRRHSNRRVRHYRGPDRRERSAATDVAGSDSVFIAAIDQARHRLAQRRGVLGDAPATTILALLQF